MSKKALNASNAISLKDAKKELNNGDIPLKKEDSLKEQIVKINLSKFASKLENKGISHIRNERETIYIYPASIPKDRINEKEGKQFRGKMRSQLKRFSNNIFFLAKGEKIEEIKKEISSFEAFYKEFYRINDYSLKSLSSSNDEGKNRDIQLLIDIISEMKIAK